MLLAGVSTELGFLPLFRRSSAVGASTLLSSVDRGLPAHVCILATSCSAQGERTLNKVVENVSLALFKDSDTYSVCTCELMCAYMCTYGCTHGCI